MPVLEYIRTMWPIAVVLLPFICATGFIWLKTQFPTLANLKATEDRIMTRIDEQDERLDTGSRTMATLDRRTALVEEECKSAPSRQNLQVELSNIAIRTRGVEAQFEGISREFGTLNTYLHTLIEQGLGRHPR